MEDFLLKVQIINFIWLKYTLGPLFRQGAITKFNIVTLHIVLAKFWMGLHSELEIKIKIA